MTKINLRFERWKRKGEKLLAIAAKKGLRLILTGQFKTENGRGDMRDKIIGLITEPKRREKMRKKIISWRKD